MKQKKAFTLIELLVVITIIALPVSILMAAPALALSPLLDEPTLTLDKPLVCDIVFSSPNGTPNVSYYAKPNGDFIFFEIKAGGNHNTI